LIVVASIVVHCCAIKKNIIVASQLYDVADVQFTVDRQDKESTRVANVAFLKPDFEILAFF